MMLIKKMCMTNISREIVQRALTTLKETVFYTAPHQIVGYEKKMVKIVLSRNCLKRGRKKYLSDFFRVATDFSTRHEIDLPSSYS